jgi:phosphoribosyl 1,2-cyclic phosphodiesterase
MLKVKAIFVSHEHTDHIKGIPVIAKKYKLPVYITDATLRGGGLILNAEQVAPFRAYEPVHIGSLAVTAFPKHHDASEPHSFIVSNGLVNIGVFTDIGVPCEHVIQHFQLCHAAFLETNYDEQLLEKGRYPWYLKNRIRGGKGHLSNSQALQLFKMHRPPFMSHLLLSHLSAENNHPDLVHALFTEHAAGVNVVIAGRSAETAVYVIGGSAVAPLTLF